MTLKNNISFHQVFAPLPTSQSSPPSSLRPQNHKEKFDSQGVGALQSPLRGLFCPSRGRGGTAPDLALVKAEQGKFFSEVHVHAKQHKEHSYSSLPP